MEIRKIMLVEDEPDIRAIGEISLARVGGWQTVLATSGEEAVAVARVERPDLIVMDVMMPGIDGPTTLARLRADPTTAFIPVVFLTAKVHPREVARYRELGALGTIAKPFDPMILPSQISALAAAASPGSTGGAGG